MDGGHQTVVHVQTANGQLSLVNPPAKGFHDLANIVVPCVEKHLLMARPGDYAESLGVLCQGVEFPGPCIISDLVRRPVKDQHGTRMDSCNVVLHLRLAEEIAAQDG
jgi:hypothetical protein